MLYAIRRRQPGMNTPRKPELLTIDAYLAGERLAGTRHEYVEGQVFAMAGGTARHNRICTRTLLALEGLGSGCDVYVADVLLRADTAFYYPDLMVICDPGDQDPRIKSAPCLIVEVLSENTERTDRGEKLRAYQRLPSLLNYLLIAQHAPRVELYRRHASDWLYESFAGSGELRLDCPSGVISLAQIYAGVVFD